MEGQAEHSYLQLDDAAGRDDGQQRVTAVREVMISRYASTGAYAFTSAATLRQHCGAVLDQAAGEAGEYCTAAVIRRMIDAELPFAALHLPSSAFTSVSTPRRLHAHLRSLKLRQQPGSNGVVKGEHAKEEGQSHAATSDDPSPHLTLPPGQRRMRFCFDLDNTLVTHPLIPHDYSSVQPIPANIHLVRELHAAGHHIIIHTSRRMRTHHGDVAAIVADVGAVTRNTLQQFGVPYDELLFGKPRADVYVDDQAVHGLLDTAKEVGWALHSSSSVDAPQGKSLSKGFVAARHFNTLQEVDEGIVKTAATEAIAGELFFYHHIPDDVRDLFPRLLRVEHRTPPPVGSDPGKGRQSVSSLYTEKVMGMTFSHLYVNRALTEGRLRKLLGVAAPHPPVDGAEGGRRRTCPARLRCLLPPADLTPTIPASRLGRVRQLRAEASSPATTATASCTPTSRSSRP